MNKAVKIWLLIIASTWQVFGAGPTLDRDDLVIPVRAPKTVVPGHFETFILELNNDFTHPLNFAVTVEKPASWHFLSEVKNVQLLPGEKRSVIFLVEIDRACEIGNQSMNFDFFDAQHDIRLNEKITTEVENIHEVEVLAIRKPSHLTGGEKFEVEFELRNLGNCEERVRVYSDDGLIVNQEFTMAPNSTHFVTVKQSVPPNLSHVGYISCGLNINVGYQDMPIREVASVKAFPKTTHKTDPYHRFPIEASLIYFGSKNVNSYNDSYQIELKGNGFLDRNERHHFDFVARGPNRFSISRVGNYDQYSFKYHWEQSRKVGTTIRLGDFSYNLSDVTEMFRWARGVAVDHKNAQFEMGVFFNMPRFYTQVDYQYAVYVKYLMSKNWSIQLNGMQKHYGLEDETASLASVKSELNLKHHKVIAELSGGQKYGKSGQAGSLQLEGNIKKLQYRSHSLYADANYPGYYTNSVFSNTSFNYRRRYWGANAGLYYNAANPAQDTIFTTAPYSLNQNLGLSVFPTTALQLQVSYIHRSKEDRFEDKKFNYRENTMRYMLQYRKKGWTSQINGEFGDTENLLLTTEDNTGKTRSVRGRLEKTIGTKLRVGGFGQYLYTNRYDREQKEYVLYGGLVSYQALKNLRITGSYRNNYLLDEYNSDRTLLDLEVSSRFKAHRFSVKTSHALIRNTVNRTDFYVNARYTYSLNTPISKKNDLYALNGVLKADNPRDAAGVILNIAGQSVITDEYGNFLVNNLPVGIHYLHIDHGTLGMGLVTKTESPVEIEMFPKETNNITIEVVRGGSIKGKINFVQDQRAANEGEKIPLRVVKISNGSQEHLTYTDNEGNFSFRNLLPGNWKVRVISGKEDGNWVLSQNNVSVNVISSREADVQFEMVAKARTVKFSNKTMNLKIKKN
mgnify:CR=1 FL=1